ncbi:50S ribosomal protein L20 [Candidatus Nomurabacteria bacterium]|nr:50S ribosomal protein L20 [Candidatus Nomurabacteria bacterium]
MVRIKGGTTANKTRRNILKKVKGYQFGRSTKEREARTAMYHAGNNAFAHRRRKKGDFRRLWSIRINAALRPLEISYSKFIGALNKKGFSVNRKMLQQIAQENPESFTRIVEQVKG